MSLKKLFPEISDCAAANLNLNLAAKEWAVTHAELFTDSKNPLIEPVLCQKMVDDVHARLGVDWSWGGYLEDRSFLWKGTYLDQTGAYIHAGVDLNLPQGTIVTAPADMKIILVDSDHPVNWGWGPRVFAQTTSSSKSSKYTFIFAHLEDISVRPGDLISGGKKLAKIGGPPKNGNWYTHLHLQAVESDYFRQLLSQGLEALDGYFHRNDLEKLSAVFPEPLGLLGLHSC